MNTQLKFRPFSLGLTLLAVVILSSCSGKTGSSDNDNTSQVSPAPNTTSTTNNLAASKTHKLAVSPAIAKLGEKPQDETTCPGDAPVKGKLTKKRGDIYHLPNTRDYDNVKPDICFKDKATAEKAGFRAPKGKG